MKLSLSTISTVNAGFAEEVEAYAAAGFDAIGLWEMKLPADDAANRALLAEHGLGVSNCVPAVPSFLQLGIPGMEGPADPGERLEAICASIERFAAYEPECVLVLSGPAGGCPGVCARGRRRRAHAAPPRSHAMLESRSASSRSIPASATTPATSSSLADALALLDEAGLDDVGIMADTYNLADERLADVVAAAPRFTGLHVADELVEPQAGVRALPGEGRARTAGARPGAARRGLGRHARRRGLLDARRLLVAAGRRGGAPGYAAARRLVS